MSISPASCCGGSPGTCARGSARADARLGAQGRWESLDDDPELKGLLAELIVEAGREQADRAMLEVQRLQLELARVDRQIQQARGRTAPT